MQSYTLSELLIRMEAQSQRDKGIIYQCVEGLGLYAAQQIRDNTFSQKPDEMRKLVENLVCYWNLDDGENAPFMEEFLEAFDERVATAKLGGEITGNTYRRQADTIYGLHRYGEEMVTAQGSDAMSEILDMSDLMRELAEYWDFQPSAPVAFHAERLRAEVREMLGGVTLPGQPVIGVNVGYQMRQAILFNNDRGFALAHNPKAAAPYVTWQFVDRENGRSYDAGSYFATEERAKLSYMSRVEGYMESYHATEKLPAADGEKTGVNEKSSVLNQIKASRMAPKTPSAPGSEREKKKQEQEH